MVNRMDRSKIIITNQRELERLDRDDWSHATVKERFETITYLRECFYGAEATTGRLQRIYTVLKQPQS